MKRLAELARWYLTDAAMRRFVFGSEQLPTDYVAWAKGVIEESWETQDNGGGPRCPIPVQWHAGDRQYVLATAEFSDESCLDVLAGAFVASDAQRGTTAQL